MLVRLRLYASVEALDFRFLNQEVIMQQIVSITTS